jgi:hypothetical protein
MPAAVAATKWACGILDRARSPQAEWKGENFDRLLSRHVAFARAANAIDETRKDFDRVG